jgi:hypothetical protein
MNFTNAEYQAYLLRSQATRKEVLGIGQPVTRERDLHDQIIDFCNSKFPRWKFIHARMDQKSTIGEGVSDFTIFMPRGQLLLVECKSSTGKISETQRDWIKEMELLGHSVHIVRSFNDFLKLCHTQPTN